MPESKIQNADELRRGAAGGQKVRPARPDSEEYERQLRDIEAAISGLRKEQDAVREQLNKTDSRKGPQADKRNRLSGRLQEIRTEQAGLRKSRGKVFDRQASLTASISKRTAELKALQAKQSYKPAEEIDAAIAEKEKLIDTGTLKIVEERRLVDEIASLRRARKHAEQAAAMQTKLDADVSELAEIDAQLADTNARALAEEYEEVQSELDSLKAQQDAGSQQRTGLFDERTRVMKALDREWDKKRTLQDDFRQKKSAFFQWQNEERKRRVQEEKLRRVQEQRERRLALAQEQREEAELPAFQAEISSCDTLIGYLGSVQPASGTRSESSTRPSSAASTAHDGDAAGAASSRGKKRSGRKDRSRGDALKLPLDVAEGLLGLQVGIPTAASGIGAAIEKLAERRRHFVEKQPAATAANKKRAEEKIAKLMADLDVDEKIAA
ncbi:multicopy suppressor of BFA (Brefeldin A) [Coemansia sp. RSA 552]|nr:multicopy suppressor of BFA (Brefeldin A) [Coemansia sp. RSA 552]